MFSADLAGTQASFGQATTIQVYQLMSGQFKLNLVCCSLATLGAISRMFELLFEWQDDSKEIAPITFFIDSFSDLEKVEQVINATIWSEKDGQPFLLLVEDLATEGSMLKSATGSHGALIAQAKAISERMESSFRHGRSTSPESAGTADAHTSKPWRPISVRSVQGAREGGVPLAAPRKRVPAKPPGASSFRGMRCLVACGVGNHGASGAVAEVGCKVMLDAARLQQCVRLSLAWLQPKLAGQEIRPSN
jgi:hypothetical protein